MKELDDKALRQQLIERYLDAETTPEEELALADFYRQSQDTLAANEEAVRQLVLATTRTDNGFTLSDEKVETFDRIMANIPPKKRRIALWPWLAAACVATIIVIILAPPRGADGNTSGQSTAKKHPRPKERPQEIQMADTLEVTPKTFLANIPTLKSSTEAEDDQSDLMSVDSVFGVETRKNPLEEYTALNEKLKRECDEVFEMIENQH
ncbi:MAG: hypothetical protein IJR02_06330 [Bacteroidaceae bacterium]|jgi:hypothetical protein|nr:hypothetical protein [Bacteroidaceae bacterium]MBQ6750371.1 hypothetical protein [Bacteroidaceae bacterium]